MSGLADRSSSSTGKKLGKSGYVPLWGSLFEQLLCDRAMILGGGDLGAGQGELLVPAEAVGVNRPDVMQRLGLYPPPPGAPSVPGLEVAGAIAGGPRDGERVCALVAGGGYAEYCVAPEGQCLPVPSGFSM